MDFFGIGEDKGVNEGLFAQRKIINDYRRFAVVLLTLRAAASAPDVSRKTADSTAPQAFLTSCCCSVILKQD
jgi:hypothetical protein